MFVFYTWSDSLHRTRNSCGAAGLAGCLCACGARKFIETMYYYILISSQHAQIPSWGRLSACGGLPTRLVRRRTMPSEFSTLLSSAAIRSVFRE